MYEIYNAENKVVVSGKYKNGLNAVNRAEKLNKEYNDHRYQARKIGRKIIKEAKKITYNYLCFHEKVKKQGQTWLHPTYEDEILESSEEHAVYMEG